MQSFHRGTDLALAWKLLAVLLLACLSTGAAKKEEEVEAKFLYEGDPEADSVKEFFGIHSKNEVFSSLGAKVVELYNPYCSHCVHFKTKYISFAVDIQSEHPEIEFHAISCLHHDALCRERFDYQSYPSLFVIPPGVNDDFKDVAVPIGQEDLTWERVEWALGEGEKRVSEKRTLLEAGGSGEEVEALVDPDERGAEVEEDGGNASGESGDVVHEDNREEDLDEPAEVDFRRGEENEESDDRGGDKQEWGDRNGDVRGGDEEDEDVGSAREKDEDGNSPGEEDEDVLSTRERDEDEDEDDEDQVEARSTSKRDHSLKHKERGSFKRDDSLKHKERGTSNRDYSSKHKEGSSANRDYSTKKQLRERSGAERKHEFPEKQDYSATKRFREQRYKAGLDVPPSKWTAGAKMARIKREEAAIYNEAYRKRFKERLERRNRMRFFKNVPAHEKWEDPDEATKLMKAYQVNTPEFQKKKQKYLDYMRQAAKRKKGLHYNPHGVHPGKIGKIAYQKKISRPKLAEKVPMIKRVVKMSQEEELMLDISLAFRHTFKHDVYRAGSVSTNKVTALMDWLDLVYVALPPEWGIQSLVSDLKQNIGPITKRYEDLRRILDKHQIHRNGWSRACWKHGALSCGYWKLFHTMTVGLAEHRGGRNLVDAGIRPEQTRTFSPLEAADTIRDFIENFFHCKHCSDHFVKDYEDCDKNRRCDRLASEIEGASDGDWKELSLWLWEAHNDISVRLLHEKADEERKRQRFGLFGRRGESGPGMASTDDAIRVLWPTLDSCITCFKIADGSWNEPMVFRHLEKTYWPGYDSEFNIANKGLVWFEGEEKSAQMLFVFLCVSVLVIFYYMIKSLKNPHQLRRTVLMAKNLARGSPKKERSV